MKKIYTIIAVLFLTVPVVKSQTLYTKSEAIKITGENLRLIVPEHRGKVQWQYSSDSLDWIDILDEVTDTMELSLFDTTGYYRAKITEDNCFPVYSDFGLFKYSVPSIEIPDLDDVGLNSAQISFKMTDNGGAVITSRGFYWSDTNTEPNQSDNIVTTGNLVTSDNGEVFTATINGLQANTVYYIRAFAVNKKGTALGEVINFTTSVNMPAVLTHSVLDVASRTARFKGEVTSDGGSEITARGFYWSTTDNTPDSNDNIERAGSGLGVYYKSVSGLQPNTKYYVCAFASSAQGTTVGVTKTFTTTEEILTESDSILYEGKKYKIVKIGSQWWMADNLAYLPTVNRLANGSFTEPRYYVYGYDGTDVYAAKQTGKYKSFGVLYNWEAAKTACPSGWHLPTDTEWEQLAQFVAENKGGTKNADGTWSNVGGQLKGKTGWFVNGGLDSYEFKALPGGYRGLGYEAKTSNILDFYGYYGMAGFWSTTQVNSQNAWGRLMILDSSDFIRPFRTKDSGTSVRCVKD